MPTISGARKMAALAILAIALSSPAVNAAEPEPDPPVATETEVESAAPEEFENVGPRVAGPMEADYLDESARMGHLLDESQVVTVEAPEVGFVIGTQESVASVGAVSVKTVTEFDEDGEVAGETASYTMGSAADADLDWGQFPVGPGAYAINFKNDDPCKTLRGGEDSENWMTTCDTVGFLDGSSTGDGRHAYDVADDDGSRRWDWWTYHSWSSVHPSDAPKIDWAVKNAKAVSYITADSALRGDSGRTDAAPNEGACDGGLSMGPWSFDFGGSLCPNGTDIILPDDHGSFGQKKSGITLSYNTVGLNYRVSARIKQGVKAEWYTVNSATFVKRFPLPSKSEDMSFVTYS